jgi:hypothetical protein
MSTPDGVHARFGQAEVLGRAAADEIPDRAGHVLDGHVRVDAMPVQKVAGTDQR